METHKIEIQPTDLALFQTLGPTLRQLKETVDMASDTKEDNISRFSFELEKVTGDLLAEVAEIRNKAQDPMVLNPSAKAESVLEFLDDLREQMDKLEKSKAKYTEWEELFKSGGSTAPDAEKKESNTPMQTESKAEEMEETKNEIELKRVLWKSLSDWDGVTS
jgi:dynein heavy chain